MEEKLTPKSGFVNLLKLKGAEEVTIKGSKGLFIPYEEKSIIRGAQGAYLNISILPLPERKYDNDYLCVRTRTKEEFETNIRTEVLGNFREASPYKKLKDTEQEENSNSFTSPQNKYDSVDDDDLDSPF